MNEAVDNLHAIERLVALASAGPDAESRALQEAHSLLSRMGLGSNASGYKAEKLKVVSEGFSALLGDKQPSYEIRLVGKTRLVRDIELLRKALARGAEGQD